MEVGILLMFISMLRIMEFLKKVVNLIRLKTQIHSDALTLTSAETVPESKALTQIIKETVGLNRDIKCGKLSNMAKYQEHKE